MEYVNINTFKASRIGLGTWAAGGWMWGGSDEKLAIETIVRALDMGINLVDTAPVYGFGHSEVIVGKALKASPNSQNAIIATKAGLDWSGKGIRRNSSPARLEKELEDSMQRLGVDHIHLYQIHWPDTSVPFEETSEALNQMMIKGKIGAVGVSNFSPEQMDQFSKCGFLHTNQPPYNLFERGVEKDVLPYCNKEGIVTLVYGAICRGLLSGKMKKDTTFEGDDLRKVDPKFKPGVYENYLKAVEKLDQLAKERFQKRVIHLALRWLLDRPGADIALWGARKPEQLDPLEEVFGWSLTEEDYSRIDEILEETVPVSIGPEFMAPPEN